MTCIVGLVDGGKVFIGGDAATAPDGWEVRAVAAPKVFYLASRGMNRGKAWTGNDEFLIGHTTSFRMGQILQYHLSVRPQQSGMDDRAYMVGVFVDAVRAALKTHGYAKIEDNREAGGTFLVGYRNKLYTVYSDFQLCEMADGCNAIGCGRQYALGCLYAVERQISGHVPLAKQRIECALRAAAHFSGGVVGPFTVLQGR